MMIVETFWTKANFFSVTNELNEIIRMIDAWIFNSFLMLVRVLIYTQWIFILGVILLYFSFFFFRIDVFLSHWMQILVFLLHVLFNCLENFKVKGCLFNFVWKLKSFFNWLLINNFNFLILISFLLSSLLWSISNSNRPFRFLFFEWASWLCLWILTWRLLLFFHLSSQISFFIFKAILT